MATEASGTARMVLDRSKILSDLDDFLINNPTARVAEKEHEEEDSKIVIENPWNDASLQIGFATDYDELVNSLNSVHLPERFSAIWHIDKHDLEVIWTAFPLAPSLKEIVGRKFNFRYKNSSCECEFSDSSERLNVISRNTSITQSSQTLGRNLGSHRNYFMIKEQNNPNMADFVANCKPLSFWIRGAGTPSEDIVPFVANLNFYLTYYDRVSPSVMIHPPKLSRESFPEKRYVVGLFPNNITGKTIDDNLLHYWEAACSGDSARRFLYHYRILEYSASLYVDQVNRAAMKRALSAPNALDDVDRISDEIMTISAKNKMDEYQKMEAMLKEYTNVSALWQIIETHKTYFSAEQTFDGGFSIKPIVAPATKEEDFAPNAALSFVRNIKDIRNALSHGKDQKTQSVILPTNHNLGALTPWVSLIAAAAGELILYRP